MDALFPPGPQKRLLLGNSVEFRHEPLTTMTEAARSYGEIVHFRFGPSHAYLVTSAEHMHYVLVERPDLFDVQHHFYRAIQSALGHELFAPKDGVYKRQRSAQPLPQNWLEAHTATITTSATQAVSHWEAGKVIDLYQEMQALTLHIASTIVFGCAADKTIRAVATNTPHGVALQDRRFASPWAIRLPMTDRAQDAVLQLIRQQPTPAGKDAMSLLKKTSLSEHHIAAELIRLFSLIHDIAATTLSWALAVLGQHPHIAEILHAELDNVLGNESPTAADLSQLVYTEMVLRETMRLYPPTWLVSRQSRREARIGSFFIPAGSTVLCSPYIMQRSPRNFVEPEKFLPERFSEGYEKRTRRYAYAPFGISAPFEQTTLLNEMKLLLTTLARRFDFTHEVNQPTEIDPLVALRPKNGLPVRVQALTVSST